MKKTLCFIIFIWLLLVGFSFTWNYFTTLQNQRHLAFQTARATFKQIILAASWNRAQGTVYVDSASIAQGNSENGEKAGLAGRRLRSPDGRLMPVGPAAMIRQISKLTENREGDPLQTRRLASFFRARRPILLGADGHQPPEKRPQGGGGVPLEK